MLPSMSVLPWCNVYQASLYLRRTLPLPFTFSASLDDLSCYSSKEGRLPPSSASQAQTGLFSFSLSEGKGARAGAPMTDNVVAEGIGRFVFSFSIVMEGGRLKSVALSRVCCLPALEPASC